MNQNHQNQDELYNALPPFTPEELSVPLTEEEQAVYRRARNSSPHTKAKNASLEQYLKATGLEAVIGYLYMSGQYERIGEIIRAVFEFHGITDD